MASVVTSGSVSVLLIGVPDDLADELVSEEGFAVERAADAASVTGGEGLDAVVVSLGGTAPLEVLGSLRRRAPRAGVVVLTGPEHEADGAVAMHAGAEDHLVTGSIPPGLLPRAVRYAISLRRLHRELATFDEATGLPNLRGFAPIADHHLRMADRAHKPVVFLFVRLDGYTELVATLGADRAGEIVVEAAEIILQAVRESDVPARVSPDTFCVLLTGEAQGAETLVLSRLVEAIAVHDARQDRPRQLSLSVGSALYDPEHPAGLEQIMQTAGRHLAEQHAGGSSAAP